MFEDWVIGVLVVAMIALIAVVTVFGIRDQLRWDKYAAEHCRKIGEISGSSTVAVGSNGKGGITVSPVYIPGKTGWACDDGQQYWR